ncbi:MAG: PTS fructose transporter subunit IIA [Lactobacillus sp.]|nr:PTS fructose transporter subunit IIA [Lactobacillus sp.]
MTTGSIRASIMQIILICMMFYLAVEKQFLNDESKEV